MMYAALVGVVSLAFQSSPVSEVADVYEECTGKRVMVYPEVTERLVTVRAFRALSQQEAAQWIQDALKLEGIEVIEQAGRVYFRAGRRPVPAELEIEAERYVFRFLPVVEFLAAVGAANQASVSTQGSAVQNQLIAEISNPGELAASAAMGSMGQAPVVGPMQMAGILGELGVRVVPDHAGNAVVFYGTKESRAKLVAMAKDMDHAPAMIEMEVIIAEYTVSDAQSVGVDWSQVFNQATESLRLAGSIRGASLIDLAQVRSGSPALFGGEGLTVFGQVSKDYTAVLQALSKLENFRIIQRPKLQTMNHKEANIFVGERVPIPGRTVTETASVRTTEYLPVRLELVVTPHLLAGGKIRLDFKQTKNDITGFSEVAGDTLPNISEQGVENIVVSGDEETVFLGGLRTRRETKTATGVPVLSKIKVLRSVFGSTKKAVETKEILLFVTPRVSSAPSEPLPALPVEETSGRDVTNLFGK